MGLFRRRPKPDTSSGQGERADALAPRTVHERIEVTVEREWVSMVVRNPAAASRADRPATDIEGSAATESNEERVLDAPDTEFPKSDQPE